MYIRNATSKRIQALKDEVIYRLWTITIDPKLDNTTSVQEFWNVGNAGFDIFLNINFIKFKIKFLVFLVFL